MWGESQGSDWSILIEPSLLTISIEPPLLVNFPGEGTSCAPER